MDSINLQRNGLGFKTGAYLMSLLVTPAVKDDTKVSKIDLGYNNISLLVQNSIRKLLSETSYQVGKEQDDPLLNVITERESDDHFENDIDENKEPVCGLGKFRNLDSPHT